MLWRVRTTLADRPGSLAPLTRVRPVVPITDTERARAAAFVEVTGGVRQLVSRSDRPHSASTVEVSPTGHHGPSDGGSPWVRIGANEDVSAVIRMHERCSVDTIYQRFHAPMPTVGRRLAGRLVSPPGGASLVAVDGDDVVGMASITPYEEAVFEVGLMVEDAWQCRGLGATLLHQAARVAKAFGAVEILCLARPHHHALLRTVTRAGLRGQVRLRDGTLEVAASVRQMRPLVVEGAPGWDRAPRSDLPAGA